MEENAAANFEQMESYTIHKLITMPMSHYCEKARWALDICGVAYNEEAHPPGCHVMATKPFGGRSVPVLVGSAEMVLTDSTPILEYCSNNATNGVSLFACEPELQEIRDLEELFDSKLGPAVRTLVYFHLLPHSGVTLSLMTSNVPTWESWATTLSFPILRGMMQSGSMDINKDGAARAENAIDEVLVHVEKLLEDGRAFLIGNSFSAADLTFASLLSPLVVPAQMKLYSETEKDFPPVLLDLVEKYRAREAGKFALRLYLEKR